MMWKHRTFDSQILGCGKVFYSNSIISIIFMLTPISNCWSENVLPTYFGIEI
jgi:hypothetical protein